MTTHKSIMSTVSASRVSCIRPSHIFRVISVAQQDISDCFEPKDLQDSMDFFWMDYDINVWRSSMENQQTLLTAKDPGYAYLHVPYLKLMETFKADAAYTKKKYLQALHTGLLGSHSEFIEEIDPVYYDREKVIRPVPIFFTDQGIMRSTRTVVTRKFKQEMLNIFKHMMTLHNKQHSITMSTDVTGSRCHT